MSEPNHRKAIRYKVAMAVSFYWRGTDQSLHEAQGVTRNISNDGALITAGQCPLLGAAIEVTVLLPRLHGHGHGMKLLGKGAVQRIDTIREGQDLTYEFAVSARWRRQKNGSSSYDCPNWIPAEAKSAYRN